MQANRNSGSKTTIINPTPGGRAETTDETSTHGFTKIGRCGFQARETKEISDEVREPGTATTARARHATSTPLAGDEMRN
jgi:hypothetical protein